jgi:Cof subfamily protein (haloacid dehalogenase superfamily)
MAFKMIFTDLDGTFLNEKGTISNENLEALERLYELGIMLVPVTGRALNAVPREVRENPRVRYVISSNGASIYDKETGKSTCSFIKHDDFLKLRAISKKYQSFPIIHHNNKVIISKDKYDNREPYPFTEYHEAYFKNYSTPIDNFDTWLDAVSGEIELVVSYFKTPAARLAFVEDIRKVKTLNCTASSPDNIETASVYASKGNAVKMLCQQIGVDISDVIAVGDGDNDPSMIAAAGLGLAVSNASDAVKSVAKRIICSHREHILKYIYENIILKENGNA